jgi:hypothetical protein
MLTELLHDKFEDLTPAALGQDRFSQVESEFRSLLRDVDPKDEWYLMERLDHLSLKKLNPTTSMSADCSIVRARPRSWSEPNSLTAWTTLWICTWMLKIPWKT